MKFHNINAHNVGVLCTEFNTKHTQTNQIRDNEGKKQIKNAETRD